MPVTHASAHRRTVEVVPPPSRGRPKRPSCWEDGQCRACRAHRSRGVSAKRPGRSLPGTEWKRQRGTIPFSFRSDQPDPPKELAVAEANESACRSFSCDVDRLGKVTVVNETQEAMTNSARQHSFRPFFVCTGSPEVSVGIFAAMCHPCPSALSAHRGWSRALEPWVRPRERNDMKIRFAVTP